MNIGPTELLLFIAFLGLPAILLPIATFILLVMIYIKVRKVEEKIR